MMHETEKKFLTELADLLEKHGASLTVDSDVVGYCGSATANLSYDIALDGFFCYEKVLFDGYYGDIEATDIRNIIKENK